STPANAPVAPVTVTPAPVPETAAEGPCDPHPVDLKTDITGLTVSNCGGGLSDIVMADEPAPLKVTPWWKWVLRLASGEREGWHPYDDPATVESLLGPAGAFGYPGAGDYAAPSGTWDLAHQGADTVLTHARADGLVVTETLAPTDAPDVFTWTVRW